MSTEIRETKLVALEALEKHAPEGHTVVRPTVIWGKPYVWTQSRSGHHRLMPWPKEVTLDV